MNPLNLRTGFVTVRFRSLSASLATITGMLVVSLSAAIAGCAPKEAAVSSAPQPAAGQPGVSSTDVKGTPKQEAAKQRAIQDGPAIQAALEAQQRGGK